MPTATIKIRAFPYYEEGEDPVTGKTLLIEKIATRGQTVELRDVDYRRAEKFGAIQNEADAQVAEIAGDGEGGSVQSSDAATLAEWIKDSKPTVDETVEAADGDPQTATKLLEAENLATGGQPRKGVVDGLTELIEKDEQPAG